MPESSTAPAAVRVWDLPTRLFHWLLVLAVIGLFVTGHVGGNAIAWHFRLGYLVMGLLVFRLVWGFVGGRWSRFASFVHGPGTVVRYLRGGQRPGEHLDVGHNPLGAGSVLALLALLAVQVGTGLISDDEIANQGPLNRYVETDTGLAAMAWHKGYGQWALVALVALHVAAIAYYLLVKKRNLVRPMIDGDKPLPATTPASSDGLGARALALALAAASAALVAWVVNR
jgi:cytochrome b